MAMMAMEKVKKEAVIVGGLVRVQLFLAANSVLLGYLMTLGLKPFTIVILFSFSTFISLFPFALYFERRKWPKQLASTLMIQLLFISFAGFCKSIPVLFLKGINLASPALATAMPNLAPGLIFIIAWTCRLEKVDLSYLYSKLKIAGTILCVLGYNNGRLARADVPVRDNLSDGMIVTAVLQLVQDHGLHWRSPLVSVKDLIYFCLLDGQGGETGGACLSFNGWAMMKRGPVLVSMFNPIGTVIAVLSVITLGGIFSLGR
ncbi:putative C2H2-like zinc finger protein [Hibiscus syriacus]|uniref:C2H2-like zinc finger protein n=1 Tax=Hibiscus syriacus TaxID=106335 RepID=A0A6A2XTU5_HIBSY|nr:putative C2H2-like zinc finger protein [Hibiscus syriacus]